MRWVDPNLLNSLIEPSSPNGTTAMLALTWPTLRFVTDVVGSMPAGVAAGVAEMNVPVLPARLLTAVMLTITPVTSATGRDDPVGAADRQRHLFHRPDRSSARPAGRNGRQTGVESSRGIDRHQTSTGVAGVDESRRRDPAEHVDDHVGGTGARPA